jgi:hypothetical protein
MVYSPLVETQILLRLTHPRKSRNETDRPSLLSTQAHERFFEYNLLR